MSSSKKNSAATSSPLIILIPHNASEYACFFIRLIHTVYCLFCPWYWRRSYLQINRHQGGFSPVTLCLSSAVVSIRCSASLSLLIFCSVCPWAQAAGGLWHWRSPALTPSVQLWLPALAITWWHGRVSTARATDSVHIHTHRHLHHI